jgi:8-oxo-dGTP pyrophosphatase MutT (NUDIX family)
MSVPSAPPVPRPSTTVLLVRDGPAGLEVLMVVRSEKSFYSSAMVFPGGVVDPEDREEAWLDHVDGGQGLEAEERAFRIAGYRELYEETGILLLDAPAAASAPRAGEAAFREVVAASGGKLDLSAMTPFARWITPEGAPKRFDAHFRLCSLTTDTVAVSDGRETVSAEWVRPAEAIALGERRERILLPPTRCQLDLLAQAGTVEDAVAAARARPIRPVTPSFTRREEGTFITIPADSGYPVLEHLAPR